MEDYASIFRASIAVDQALRTSEGVLGGGDGPRHEPDVKIGLCEGGLRKSGEEHKTGQHKGRQSEGRWSGKRSNGGRNEGRKESEETGGNGGECGTDIFHDDHLIIDDESDHGPFARSRTLLQSC